MNAFFQLYDDFVQRLRDICPEISTYIDIVENIKRTDRKLLYDIFLTSLAPYSAQIISKNEKFFVEEMPKTDNPIIESLKKKICTLDKREKDIVWFYLNEMLLSASEVTEPVNESDFYKYFST